MKKLLFGIALIFVISMGLLWLNVRSNKKEELKKLIVGLNAEYPPFAFLKNNHIIGFDVDLITEISKRLKQDIELRDMSFSSLIPGIQLGSIDIIISGITPTPERSKEVVFTAPYLRSDPLVIISPKDKPVKAIGDFKDKRVVVNEGFSADFYVSKLPGPKIVRLETIDQAFLELASGRAQAFVSALNPLKPFLELHNDNEFIITPIPDTEETYAIGISKYKKYLVKEIQFILNHLKKDGTIDHLKHKWNLNV